MAIIAATDDTWPHATITNTNQPAKDYEHVRHEIAKSRVVTTQHVCVTKTTEWINLSRTDLRATIGNTIYESSSSIRSYTKQTS